MAINPTTQDFTKALGTAYSNLTFDKFCEVIGEPPHHGNGVNEYADEKWKAFKTLAMASNKLGNMLDAIIAYGEESIAKRNLAKREAAPSDRITRYG